MADEPDEIVVRCTRCADGDYPVSLDVVQRDCSKCGQKVWLERALPDDIATKFPGQAYVLVCMHCDAGELRGAVITTPAQIQRMLDSGLAPEQVVHAVAIAKASAGNLTLEETALEIHRYPRGARAETYRKARSEVSILVSGLLRRN